MDIQEVNIPTSLESRDDRANESTLYINQYIILIAFHPISAVAYLDAIGLDSNEAIHKVSQCINLSPPEKLPLPSTHSIAGETTYVCSVDIMSSLSLARSSRVFADARRKP